MIGQTLGTYQIVAKLGEGGMGQVYRARDRKLDRDVALKILPEGFASDADRLMRFTREAKTLASLNHPHIAQVYDTGREGSTAFIAMELVDGEDLSVRINRAVLPWREALELARQVADALAAAHDAGVIHRDLKPANIKVRDDGTVKVLDFGLARTDASGSSDESAPAATMTSPAMTAMGMILGTAAYMAPEQARGKPVDRRADVWAFGVVLYEMIAGGRLFGREEVSDTLAAVLTHEPDLAKLPANTPASIRRLLTRCLAKDKRARLDSMTAARLEIEDALNPREAATASTSSPSPWLGKALALGLVTFALGWIASSFRSQTTSGNSSASQPVFSYIAAPDRAFSAFHDGFALSPDGETLAFTARDQTGARQIWTRRLSTLDEEPVRGTEGGKYPTWSPNGVEIAFFVDGTLRRVPATGGQSQKVGDAPGIFPRASWGPDNVILFSGYHNRRWAIFKVPAGGGPVIEMTQLGASVAPTWLADGKRFLYVGTKAGLQIAMADGSGSKLVQEMSFSGNYFYSRDGYVFQNKNDALTVQRLDPDQAALVGPAVAIAGVAGDVKGWFSLSSAAGRVVGFVRRSPAHIGSPGDPIARLQWVNREGQFIGTLGPAGRYWTLRLSPEGHRAVVNQGDDLYVIQPGGGVARVSSGTGNWNPVWSTTGTELVFSSLTTVKRQRLESGAQSTSLENLNGRPNDWSFDQNWLLTTTGSSSGDINVYDMRAKAAKPWVATNANEFGARFSPNAKWVAYASDESGRLEVYVKPFEGAGEPMAISSNGGAHPAWRRDGRELFFLGADGSMMAADFIVTGNVIERSGPRVLFRIPLNDITSDWFTPYDVTPDGQRFLLNIPERPEPLLFLQGLDAIMAGRK